MITKQIITLLRYAAVGGNILFVFWMLFNAMDDGFNGTLVEKASCATLIGLLALNCFFLLNKNLQNNTNQLTGHQELK
jgi:hypothetical protein